MRWQGGYSARNLKEEDVGRRGEGRAPTAHAARVMTEGEEDFGARHREMNRTVVREERRALLNSRKGVSVEQGKMSVHEQGVQVYLGCRRARGP